MWDQAIFVLTSLFELITNPAPQISPITNPAPQISPITNPVSRPVERSSQRVLHKKTQLFEMDQNPSTPNSWGGGQLITAVCSKSNQKKWSQNQPKSEFCNDFHGFCIPHTILCDSLALLKLLWSCGCMFLPKNNKRFYVLLLHLWKLGHPITWVSSSEATQLRGWARLRPTVTWVRQEFQASQSVLCFYTTQETSPKLSSVIWRCYRPQHSFFPLISIESSRTPWKS